MNQPHETRISHRLVTLGILVLLILSSYTSVAASASFVQLPADGNDSIYSISTDQTADDFQVDNNMEIATITWWGTYSEDPANLPTDQFQIKLFLNDGSGIPVITPFVNFNAQPIRSLTALQDSIGSPVYRFDFPLPQAQWVSISANQSYSLSVVNAFDQTEPNPNWYWLMSDYSGLNFYRYTNTESWSPSATGNLSFAISEVPVPAAFWLFISGLSALFSFCYQREI